MAGEIVKMGDNYAAVVAGPGNGAEAVAAPRFCADFVCWGKNEAGENVKLWEQPWSNVVVNQGRALILNRLFAGWTSYSNGIGLFLHSASTGSNNVWSQISASQVSNYGASMPAITFATSQTAASDSGHNLLTATASYGFTAGTQTVNGAGVLFHTSASIATNAATADLRLYCYGIFNGSSQQVQSGNTLSVTLSVSYQSA